MQKRCLASVVETEEQELGMLVEQPERGKDVPDCGVGSVSDMMVDTNRMSTMLGSMRIRFSGSLHQLIMNMRAAS